MFQDDTSWKQNVSQTNDVPYSRKTSTMLIFSWTLAPPDQPLRSSQLQRGDAWRKLKLAERSGWLRFDLAKAQVQALP